MTKEQLKSTVLRIKIAIRNEIIFSKNKDTTLEDYVILITPKTLRRLVDEIGEGLLLDPLKKTFGGVSYFLIKSESQHREDIIEMVHKCNTKLI